MGTITKQIYLDNASTTKIDPKVLKEMLPYLKDNYGNASSKHTLGVEARKAIEKARKIIADKIGAKSGEIVFTGSGSEANNLALKGIFFWSKKNTGKNHIITTKIEHDSVLETCKWLQNQGAKITYLDVDKEGFVNLEELNNAINDKTILVSIIHGNNEIGSIQDIEGMGKICKGKNILFHIDACQSFTKTFIDVKKQNVDLATVNSHKIHGSKGVGALYIKEELKNKIIPLIHGGGQEFGLRSSTENVSGIVGFGRAVTLFSGKDIEIMTKLRDYFISELLKIENTRLNGASGRKRLCNNLSLAFSGVEAETLTSYLNAKNIFISAGSACSSNKTGTSHVLRAMGLSKAASESTIRASLSRFNTKGEINFAIKEIKSAVKILRK